MCETFKGSLDVWGFWERMFRIQLKNPYFKTINYSDAVGALGYTFHSVFLVQFKCFGNVKNNEMNTVLLINPTSGLS